MSVSSGDFLKRRWAHHVGSGVAFQDARDATNIRLPRCTDLDRVRRNRVDAGQTMGSKSALSWQKRDRAKHQGDVMGEITQFIAVPIDRTDQGLVAGEAFKCASPQAAIERAKGFWQVMGHAGAVAAVRTGYPDTTTTVLRCFGSVPEQLEV
jgi:hypothetical protein